MNQKSSHIEFEQLVDLSDNRVSTAQRASLLEHASNCVRCTHELSRVQHVVNLMRADTTEDAPRDVLANAVNLFRSQFGAPQQTIVQRVLGVLTFDSLTASPAYGLRSGATAATRQLLYAAEENDLDLRIEQSGAASWEVSGQVLGECATGGQVELHDPSGNVAAKSVLNDVCEFALPAVSAGTYSLHLRLAATLIEVREIELKA